MPITWARRPTARASIRSAHSTRSSATANLLGQVAPEGAQGEDHPVEVVIDVKGAREPGAGEPRLVPGPVGALGVDEEANGALGRVALTRRHQALERPTGLGRGRVPPTSPR